MLARIGVKFVFLGRPAGNFFCCGSVASKTFADLAALSARYSSLLMVGKKLAIDAAIIYSNLHLDS